jgi:hypothetical protein
MKLIKQQNQRSGCLLLTLKQKDQAILQNPSTSFMVKSSRSNEGRVQTHASVLGMEERGKERTVASFLCCRLITVGSWLEPTVIVPNHCPLLA